MTGLLVLAWLISLCHGQEIQEIAIKSVVEKGPDEAYKDCPCKAMDAIFSALGDDIPSNYGSNCRAWDAHGTGWDKCRVAKPPHYCSMKWCYVEASNCNRSHEASLVFPGVRYSWASCGSINFLDMKVAVSSLHKLRNGLISTGLRPPTFGEDNRGFATIISYARFLLEDMDINPDFQVTHHALSDDGKQVMNTNSTYTACVYDLAVGHLDVCLYDFWLTQARINTGAIPIAVYQDTFYLWVKDTSLGESYWQATMKPFLPFSAKLWGLIFAVLIVHAFAMAGFQEGFSVMLCRPKAIIDQMYLSLLGFFSGGVVIDHYYQSKAKNLKPASRVMAVGFSFFCTIALASFTGSTASFLMNNAAKPSVSSLEDALSDGSKRICYPQEIQAALLAKYPNLEKLGISVGWSSDRSIFQEVNDGICEITVASYAYSIELEDVSDFVMVGHHVHSLPIGFFVSQELGPHFLFHNSKLKQIGEWAKLERNWLQTFPGQQSQADEGNSDSSQLQATHMMGNCFVLIGCTALGLVMHFFHMVHQNSDEVTQFVSTSVRQISGTSDSEGVGTSKGQDSEASEGQGLHITAFRSGVSDGSAPCQYKLDDQPSISRSLAVTCHHDAKSMLIPEQLWLEVGQVLNERIYGMQAPVSEESTSAAGFCFQESASDAFSGRKPSCPAARFMSQEHIGKVQLTILSQAEPLSPSAELV